MLLRPVSWPDKELRVTPDDVFKWPIVERIGWRIFRACLLLLLLMRTAFITIEIAVMIPVIQTFTFHGVVNDSKTWEGGRYSV